MIWLSVLCPSCRPADLKRWLDSLLIHADAPRAIELSLILEHGVMPPASTEPFAVTRFSWVQAGAFNVNELQQFAYQESTAPFVMLSGDDTVCETPHWDTILRQTVEGKGDVVLAYPDDGIFGETLACYPVTSRLVMDSVPWPLPYKRYCIDDTIFDIVPKERRIYVPQVVMRHLHLREQPPGHLVMRDGRAMYYPHEQPVFSEDRALYKSLAPERAAIREALRAKMIALPSGSTV